ncbi:hypothetical protein [Viridibacillus soli]|nr:hypothetical protein [Viridibacillus soli]
MNQFTTDIVQALVKKEDITVFFVASGIGRKLGGFSFSLYID